MLTQRMCLCRLTALVVFGLVVRPARGYCPIFDSGLVFEVGAGASHAAAGDLNGDGLVDLAVVNFFDDNISILLATGSGIYGNATDYGLLPRPSNVELVDADADGDLDVLVLERGASEMDPGYLAVLLNHGDGTFAEPLHNDAGIGVGKFAAGDLDGDGDIDAVVGQGQSYHQSGFSVLLSHGDATFAPPVHFSGAWRCGSTVTLVDLDGDGDLDLATTHSSERDFSIWRNQGDGTFEYVLWMAVAYGPLSLTAADVDGDGDADLAVARYDMYEGPSGTLCVLRNRGDGTVDPPTMYNTGAMACSVAAGDLDTDGDADLVVASSDGQLTIHFNDGTGTFSDSAAQFAGTAIGSPRIADLDADTIPDLLLPLGLGCAVSVLPGVGDGTFMLATQFTLEGDAADVALGDLDADGDDDLAVLDDFYDDVLVFANDGAGHFVLAAAYGVGFDWPQALAIGDLDGDGDTDCAVVGGYAGGSLAVLRNDGFGAFGAPQSYPAGEQPSDVALADLDGDGDVDAAVTDGESNNLFVYRNTGTGTFAAPDSYATASPTWALAIADLDTDGDCDIVAVGGARAQVFLNGGGGTFAPYVTYLVGPGATGIATSDLDGDMDLDLAVSNDGGDWQHGTVSVLKNNGAAVFGPREFYGAGTTTTCVAVTDLDGNGTPDLVAGNRYGASVSLFSNDGVGSFALYGTQATGCRASRIVAGDLNADGAVDVAVADGLGTVTILVNRSSHVRILQPPLSHSVPAGDPATLSVTASGEEPLEYQWRRHLGGTWVDLLDDGRIVGATTPDLIINSFGPDDVGDYDVVVTNPCGTLTSESARLRISGSQCGDLDDDGDVDGTDYALFRAAFGRSLGDPAYDPLADFDGDGTITFVDYQAWLVCYRAYVRRFPCGTSRPDAAPLNDGGGLAPTLKTPRPAPPPSE